jgi:hypothetical protein
MLDLDDESYPKYRTNTTMDDSDVKTIRSINTTCVEMYVR